MIILLAGVILLPYFLFTQNTIDNQFVLMLVKTLIPTYAAGFTLYSGALEIIFMKMDLLNVIE